MQNRPNLIGFGSVAVDDLLYIPFYPAPDSKIQVEDHLRLGGGLAGTALVAAARLGANPAYFGVLGNNDLSAFTIRSFHDEGVQTSLCMMEDEARPLHSSILVDRSSGGRTILFSVENFKVPSSQNVTAETFEGCKMIFIDTFAAPIFSHVCDLAQRLQIPILADIEDIAIQSQQQALDAVVYLIFNKSLAQIMTGEDEPDRILHALETPARIATVITAGANGCWFKENKQKSYYLPAYPVQSVDTTGCGDVFHGAFASAILRNCTVTNAVMQASAAAAVKATRPGGRAGIPDLKQLQQFMAENPHIQPEELS
jgi:sulfofructose kinase